MENAPRAPFADAPPRVKRLILALTVLITTSGTVGLALLPSLSVKHPMVLLALAPNYLGLVAPRVEFAPAFALVSLRRFLGMCSVYGLGGLYGEATLRALTARSPRVKRAVRWVTDRFQRYGMVFLIATPGVAVSLIAGVSGMRPRRFALGSLLGQMIWTAVYFRFAMAISAFSERALRFMERNLLSVSLVVALSVVLQQLLARRRARANASPPRV